MAPNPRRIDEALDALYARLPKIECQRLCHDSCGPISTAVRERERMEKLAGHRLGCNGIKCNMLVEGKCSVYSARPMICRLWGIVESLPCHYGCRPEGGLLPDEQGAAFLKESVEIGGPVTHADAELIRLMEEARDANDEEFKATLKALFQKTVPRPDLAARSEFGAPISLLEWRAGGVSRGRRRR